MSEATNVRSGAATGGWKPGMNSEPNSKGRSLIGPTVVIRGEVVAEEDLLIMGRIEGFIDHSRTVTIHANGTVAAEVKAQEVLVEGQVDGNVYGTRRVEIAQTGRVNGNVYAPRVGVLEGASFKGAIDMESDVSVIERRFRENTGTEAPAKPAKHEAKANTPKGDSNAAQAEEKGHSQNATESAAGTDAGAGDGNG